MIHEEEYRKLLFETLDSVSDRIQGEAQKDEDAMHTINVKQGNTIEADQRKRTYFQACYIEIKRYDTQGKEDPIPARGTFPYTSLRLCFDVKRSEGKFHMTAAESGWGYYTKTPIATALSEEEFRNDLATLLTCSMSSIAHRSGVPIDANAHPVLLAYNEFAFRRDIYSAKQ